MASEPKLRYPDCEECQFLYRIGVDNRQINDLHEDKITIHQLPKMAKKLLNRWRVRKGYVQDE